MAAKKKRLTVREKAERERMRKALKSEGLLPPDKPRLNRRKFAQEAVETFRAEINLSYIADILWVSEALAVMTAGWELRPITPEQIGVFKAMRMAVEMKRLRAKCKERGETLTIEALFDAVEAIKNQ